MARLCLVSALLIQIILPSGQALAAPPLQSTPPLTDAPPRAEPVTAQPPSEPMLPPVLPTENTEPTLPPIAANVLFDLAEPVVVAGEKVLLTITVRGEFESPIKELLLTLQLPLGVTAEGAKGELRWPLPTQLTDRPFVQAITLQVDPANLTTASAVLPLVATLTAPGYASGTWSNTIGIARDKGGSEAVIEARQSDMGTVLQESSGLFSLLVDPTAAKTATRFVYTELYRWDKETQAGDKETRDTETRDTGLITATSSLSTTAVTSETAAPANQLFLPLVNAGDEATAAGVAPVELPPARDAGGVQLYYQWAFTAEQEGTKVAHFDEALQLNLSLTKLIEAGVDPKQLELWTRESEKERWQIVRSDYDAKRARLTAFLPHFTEFGLGAGLSQHGEILPSTIGFTTDRQTGTASIQQPIETPAGVGGLNPNLSFSYSSMASDDLFLESGQDYTSQTSGVGMGWGVSGSNNFVIDTGAGYSVVLNGMRLNLREEEGAWRTDPETFYQVHWAPIEQGEPNPVTHWGTWTLRAPNGTKYEFGDPNPFTGYSATSATAVFLETTIPNGSSYYRLAKQWYLRQVTDTLGNYITYQYKAEKGIETSCIDENWDMAERWYTRAIYPTEIQWGGNITTGFPAKMKVLFNYSTADREDYQIEDWGSTDCKQVKFAIYDRLLDLTVQVDSNGWQSLRSYTLNQSYYVDPTSTKKRLLLNTVETHGRNGGLLQTYTFTYKYGDGIAAGPNRIWVATAANGRGAKITYTYASHRPECPTFICGQNTEHGWRNAVTQTKLDTGLNRTRYVKYYYGPTNNLDDEWGRIGIEDVSTQFFGFKESQATYFDVNSTFSGDVLKWDKQEFWPGAQDNPDPRAGKPTKIEVRTSKTGPIVAVTNYQWQAVRRVGGAWVNTNRNRETNSGVTT